jgi:predicted dehydrogenase
MSNSLHQLDRREMLRRTALIGFGVCSAGPFLARPRVEAANEKLSIAIVGAGGRGWDNLNGVQGENIVALCDVDDRSAAKAYEAFPKAARFRDYRKMFDTMHAGIDAVVCSTPDHMHAPVCLAAMRLGKHVYCEKPLTWSIEEARLMASTATEQRVRTQMGTQGMAGNNARAGVEVIRSGVLGEVSELHVWTDRAAGWWPQGVERPAEAEAPPKELDWDLWLGVAPKRPYHSSYAPFRWRGWQDFGTGAVGDMGIHNAAMAIVGLELNAPTVVEIVETSSVMKDTFPAWSKLRFQFERREGHVPITMYWYDGGKRPSAELIDGGELANNGAIVVGSKGTLYSIEWTGGDWRLLPAEKFRDFTKPTPSLARAPNENHYDEWIQAAKGGAPAFCAFETFGSKLTEIMLVGNLALRTGKRIDWDSEKMEARGCPEAEPYIRRRYRDGWDGVRGDVGRPAAK